ncbi:MULTISPECIES: LysR substrate-binding domain-containing protein [unclassified Agarivorans]|uniref:LysR family transcriptional regulator n=1 Tax=unclassified Agarivorans TaxID=2636026 RepID=UPI003D7E1BC3
MDRFKEMQVFVRIAERNSFALAADDLSIPRPTMTNIIKRLESRLGIRLLERTTRQVHMTHEGESYYRQCVGLLSDLEEIESSFLEVLPKGHLRVNLQGTLAKYFVMPKIADFIRQYPDITLHIAEDDKLIDLVHEGVDCVLRAGPLQDSSLIAQKIAEMTQVTVASPAYLEAFGIPKSLDDLQEHLAVGYSFAQLSKPSSLAFKLKNKYISINLASRTSVAGADLYTGCAVAGLGLIQVPKYRLVNELANGSLVEVLADFPPPQMPVSIVYPNHRHLSARTRVFIQWLKSQFQENKR